MLLVANVADINSNSLILALMLGVAVGIDYALFIVSRYRHELWYEKTALKPPGGPSAPRARRWSSPG